MARRFDDILSECTERLLQGESVEQCLQRYPEQADDLEPLLRIAAAARKTSSAIEPRPEFKARVRYELQSRVRLKASTTRSKMISAPRWVPRWAVGAACVALALVVLGGGTVAASSSSVPGDALYPVKTATEQVQMSLTFSKGAKAKLQARFAQRRAREMARLAGRGRAGQLGSLASRFEAHLANVERLANEISATDPADGERISKLREILNTNMARDLVLLEEAEAKAPWQTRGTIAVAKFRLIQEYEKAIDALDELQVQQQAQAGQSGTTEGGSQSGGTQGGSGGGTGYGGGSAGSGQQGPLTSMGLQVQARCAGPR
ncbi:MAG: DUF5667 domain-containing protein [Dehalococcoidia bacterium]|nr:DUF5667 domain-containing protein [Dehalococcoidia bacterium]